MATTIGRITFSADPNQDANIRIVYEQIGIYGRSFKLYEHDIHVGTFTIRTNMIIVDWLLPTTNARARTRGIDIGRFMIGDFSDVPDGFGFVDSAFYRVWTYIVGQYAPIFV